MSQYYYLLPSLPFLRYEGEVELSEEKFLQDCANNMPVEEFELLAQCRLDDFSVEATHPLTAAWQGWAIALRNELALARALKLKKDGEKYLRPGADAGSAFVLAREAETQANPAQAEELLLTRAWSFLEELNAGHIFDLTDLLVYYLKLQLLLRKAKINDTKGSAVYQRVYQTVAAQVKQASGYDTP